MTARLARVSEHAGRHSLVFSNGHVARSVLRSGMDPLEVADALQEAAKGVLDHLTENCPECEGHGMVFDESERWDEEGMVFCSECGGRGRVNKNITGEG